MHTKRVLFSIILTVIFLLASYPAAARYSSFDKHTMQFDVFCAKFVSAALSEP
jgi:hypothetical protein